MSKMLMVKTSLKHGGGEKNYKAIYYFTLILFFYEIKLMFYLLKQAFFLLYKFKHLRCLTQY